MKFLVLLQIIILFILPFYSYAQPINDNCSDAIELTDVESWCSADDEYTNVDASSSGFGPADCWNNSSGNDIWFKFTAIATTVNIQVNGANTGHGSLNYPKIALYSGNCNGTINMYECSESGSASSGFASIYQGGLNIGQEYLIRIDAGANETGTFQLCINNFTNAPEPGQDCITNSFLCNTNSITKVALAGGGSNPNEGEGTCLDNGINTESNSVWYTWTAAEDGPLTFTIKPNNPNDDLDFVLFILPNGDCNNKSAIRCNAAWCSNLPDQHVGLNMTATDDTEDPGCSNGQDNWLRYVDMVEGTTYGLLINNFTDASTGTDNGFTLDFGQDATFSGPTTKIKPSAWSACINNNQFTFEDSTENALTYKWYFGADASVDSSDVAGPHTISYSTPGIKTVVLVVTGNGGCEVVDYVQVYVSNPSVNLGNDTIFCLGDSLILTPDTGYVSYEWNDSTFSPTKVVKQSGTYSVTVTDTSGCTATDEINITVLDCSILNISTTNDTVCKRDSAMLTVSAFSTQGGECTYQWEGNYGTNDTIYVSAASTTPILVTATDTLGNSISDTAWVIVIETTAIFTYDYLDNETIDFLNLSTDANAFLWDFDDDTNTISTEVNPIHNYGDSGYYYVTLIALDTNWGCIDTISDTVRTYLNIRFFVPSAFTPNNDDINEKFYPIGSGYKSYTMKIYSRWGNLVFDSNGDENSYWDGTNLAGEEVPEGVYIYYFYITPMFGEVIEKRGHVSVVY